MAAEYLWYTAIFLGLLLLVYIIPATALFIKVLELMNVDPEVLQFMTSFCVYCLPYIMIVGLSFIVQGYCNSQEIEKISIVFEVIAVFICIGVMYYIIDVKKMGFFGVSLGFLLTEVCTLFLYLTTMVIYCHKESLILPKFERFAKEFCPYCCECVKFIISGSCEDMTFEINSIFIILFYSNEEVSAYFNALNFAYIVYVFGIGMGTVIRTQLGFFLGKNRQNEAKHFYFSVIFYHMIVAVCCSTVPFFFNR